MGEEHRLDIRARPSRGPNFQTGTTDEKPDVYCRRSSWYTTLQTVIVTAVRSTRVHGRLAMKGALKSTVLFELSDWCFPRVHLRKPTLEGGNRKQNHEPSNERSSSDITFEWGHESYSNPVYQKAAQILQFAQRDRFIQSSCDTILTLHMQSCYEILTSEPLILQVWKRLDQGFPGVTWRSVMKDLQWNIEVL
ncbi:hypothetical protein OG21DRAFT_1520106 [Imleria badia]|nr:hypothetical protein OG21DRAFT_1520106 [Imleria badia]